MNSIEQKKSDVVKRKLYFLALNYLKRYSVSVFQFEAYLKRKYQRTFSELLLKDDYLEAVKQLIAQLISQGYLNDERYLESKTDHFFERGKSVFYIKQALFQKGFDEQTILNAIDAYYEKNQLDPKALEIEQIYKLARKKKLGRSEDNFKKDLMKLIRGGYSYDASKKVMENLLIEEGGD